MIRLSSFTAGKDRLGGTHKLMAMATRGPLLRHVRFSSSELDRTAAVAKKTGTEPDRGSIFRNGPKNRRIYDLFLGPVAKRSSITRSVFRTEPFLKPVLNRIFGSVHSPGFTHVPCLFDW